MQRNCKQQSKIWDPLLTVILSVYIFPNEKDTVLYIACKIVYFAQRTVLVLCKKKKKTIEKDLDV